MTKNMLIIQVQILGDELTWISRRNFAWPLNTTTILFWQTIWCIAFWSLSLYWNITYILICLWLKIIAKQLEGNQTKLQCEIFFSYYLDFLHYFLFILRYEEVTCDDTDHVTADVLATCKRRKQRSFAKRRTLGAMVLDQEAKSHQWIFIQVGRSELTTFFRSLNGKSEFRSSSNGNCKLILWKQNVCINVTKWDICFYKDPIAIFISLFCACKI